MRRRAVLAGLMAAPFVITRAKAGNFQPGLGGGARRFGTIFFPPDGGARYQNAEIPLGLTDTKVGILSGWMQVSNVGPSGNRFYSNSSSRVVFSITSGGVLQVLAQNSGASTILNITTATTKVSDGKMHHFAAMWDLATPGSGGIFIDGVSDYVETTFTDDSIDYTGDDYAIGRNNSSTRGPRGFLGELYINTDEYIDLSIAANLQRFRLPSGRPRDLHHDGSFPTGTAPRFYFANHNYILFGVNRGSARGRLNVRNTGITTGRTLPF